MTGSAVVTLLFTDLVGSTSLKHELGDEDAELVRRTHFRLLREAVAARGGHEVKNLGDGLMVVFDSAIEGCSCAVAMQQSVDRHNRLNRDTRLHVRIGLHLGEPIRDEDDYFGSDVDLAKRICDAAEGEQILASDVIRSLVANRAGHSFRPVGELDLKGISEPVPASELRWAPARGTGVVTRTPFVGRAAEMARFDAHLTEATAGRGGLLMVAGEPGIGKTRAAEEFAERARSSGSLVLWGRCFEGDWTPPYAPFGEAIETHALDAETEALRADLGHGAAAIAQIAPKLRDVLPGVGDPERLSPDEERFRLLDAVAQWLIAVSKRAPVVLVLDDVHWADAGSVAMLRHTARFAPRNRLLILGLYRDVELDRKHPLASALGALRREVEYERLRLTGLQPDAVGELLATMAEHDVPRQLSDAIASETDGNPFFIREVLLHLIEEGKIVQDTDGRWTSSLSIREMGIPEGVREVVGRRLSRLSEGTNDLLTGACAFDGPFRLDVVASVAGLDELAALDALDEALDAQIVAPSAEPDSYVFTHALLRHSLESELSPSRQVRLHRRVAETLEERYGHDLTAEQCAEIAYQYHRSHAMPGAERGVSFALRAAEHAEASGAYDEAASFYRMTLELLPEADSRRARVQGKLAIALGWALQPEAAEMAADAAHAIAELESPAAAAEYLADACQAVGASGHQRSWPLARLGLEFNGGTRDLVWARLTVIDLIRREAEDSENPGVPLDVPERREANAVLRAHATGPEIGVGFVMGLANSKRELLSVAPDPHPGVSLFWLGDFGRALEGFEAEADEALRTGRVALAARALAFAARACFSLARFEDGDERYARGVPILERVPDDMLTVLQFTAAVDERRMAVDEGWEETGGLMGEVQEDDPANRWALAAIHAALARAAARAGAEGPALARLERLVAPLERAPGIAANYTRIACDAAETLWLLECTDHLDVVERNVHEKVVTPDWRYPMMDGRLALARLCALRGGYEEAASWFEQARPILESEGPLPLRPVVDFDEALMYVRRDGAGDRARARPLLEAAAEGFEAHEMTGWLRRVAEVEGKIT